MNEEKTITLTQIRRHTLEESEAFCKMLWGLGGKCIWMRFPEDAFAHNDFSIPKENFDEFVNNLKNHSQFIIG